MFLLLSAHYLARSTLCWSKANRDTHLDRDEPGDVGIIGSLGV